MSPVSWSGSLPHEAAVARMKPPTLLVALVPGSRLGLLLAPFVLVACAGPRSVARPANAALVDIQESAVPLAAWFDRERDEPRAIFLLSPV